MYNPMDFIFRLVLPTTRRSIPGPLDDIMPTPVHKPTSTTQRTGELHMLEQQVDRLSLICEAMFELIKTRTDITDTELLGQMAELDLSDGAADGKVTRPPVMCPHCNRPNSRRRELCLYCGEAIKSKPFE